MNSTDTLKQRVIAQVDGLRDQLLQIADEIHANPEIGFEEFKAAALLSRTLEKNGFAVERGVLHNRWNPGPDLDMAHGRVGPIASGELEGLPVRCIWAVRLSRTLFFCLAHGTCSRGRADRISLALADRAVFRALAG